MRRSFSTSLQICKKIRKRSHNFTTIANSLNFSIKLYFQPRKNKSYFFDLECIPEMSYFSSKNPKTLSLSVLLASSGTKLTSNEIVYFLKEHIQISAIPATHYLETTSSLLSLVRSFHPSNFYHVSPG